MKGGGYRIAPTAHADERVGGGKNVPVRALPSSRSFTPVELIAGTVIIILLLGVFVNRTLFYQEQAEKAAMETVAGAVQTALLIQYWQAAIRGNPADVAALARDNPMNWLRKPPYNYAGEFYAPTPRAAGPGNWMFDLKSRELVYVLRNANHFTPGDDGKKWIRFHVAMKNETPHQPSLQNTPAGVAGVLFEPVEPYVWF